MAVTLELVDMLVKLAYIEGIEAGFHEAKKDDASQLSKLQLWQGSDAKARMEIATSLASE